MSTVTITNSDNGHVVEARKGDMIVLRLPENPTTGFRWQLDRVPGTLELMDDSYQPDPDMQFGSGGVRTFRFRSLETGTGRAELKHWQEWEGDRSTTDRFTVEIQVTA